MLFLNGVYVAVGVLIVALKLLMVGGQWERMIEHVVLVVADLFVFVLVVVIINVMVQFVVVDIIIIIIIVVVFTICYF